MATSKDKVPLIIIGGGLAGLSLAARLERAQQNYLLVEAHEIGGFAKSQLLNGAVLDYGLKSIPLIGPLDENPLIELKNSLDLKVQVESFSTPPQFFENKVFSDFVGFGETKNRHLVEEMSYYTLFPRLLISGGWGQLIDELVGIIPEKKRLRNAQVTKFEVKDELVSAVIINGQQRLEAQKVVFTLSPSLIKDLFPSGAVSAKTIQRIARTEPLTLMSLDLAHNEPMRLDPKLLILRQDDFFVIGQFTSSLDPLRTRGSAHISTWMTFLEADTLHDDETGSKNIKATKKLIDKAFPKLCENAQWERLLVVPQALGHFQQLVLEKDNTLPGLSNFYLAGGKLPGPERNLSQALATAKKVFQELTPPEFHDLKSKDL